MKGQIENNEKSPKDWHLRLNLSEYSETIKEFVSPIIPGYHFPEKDILHCSLVHGKGIIIIICVCIVDGLSTLSCIEHDRLPFSDILGAPRVLSAPQLMFYLLPLAPRILKSGETYL